MSNENGTTPPPGDTEYGNVYARDKAASEMDAAEKIERARRDLLAYEYATGKRATCPDKS